MKKVTLFLVSLIFFSSSSYAIGPFNTLSLRTPSTNGTISLIEVDFALALARDQIQAANPGLTLPSISTNDLANRGFAEVATLKRQLENSIRSEILSIGEVRSVGAVNVDFLPFEIVLRQQNNALLVSVDGLSANVFGEAESQGIFCRTPSFSVALDDISATLQFNLFTGNLMVSDINFNVSSNANCGGLLGFIGDLFADGILRDLIDDSIEGGLASINGIVENQNLFGINDLVEVVSAVITGAADRLNLPAPGPQIVNRELGEISNFLEGVNINSGLQVGIRLTEKITRTDGEGGFFLFITERDLELSTNF
ncbi:hypothetical protein EYS14_22945 [Alteromonadaceae bacterium M269]|nr:hypothetical protein EYS14_22945 [Alteromonadaceae bacterium M269]